MKQEKRINILTLKGAKLRHSSLSDLMNQLIELVSFFENELTTNCSENYKNTVTGLLTKLPISFGVGSTIHDEYGRTINAEEARHKLSNYVDSLNSLKYLSFLKDEKKNVVFIGPNGSGKTTLIRTLYQKLNSDDVLFFVADRMLTINSITNSILTNFEKLKESVEESYKETISIRGSAFDSSKLFTLYLSLLKEERFFENEHNIKGPAYKIIEKWHELIKNRELFFEHDLCVKPTGASDNEKYNIEYLSSGEKSILFFLMGILLNKEKAYYFVDEPENNLNPAIVSELWDYLQKERPNSIFVYLTHDSSFATSRINAKEYWIKGYDGKNWNYEPLPESESLPKQLLIELMGSKQPIIFCESEDKSKLDYQLFKKMFPGFNIVPSGGCDKVISNTKGYRRLNFLEKAYGIIDVDYKDNNYLDALESDNVYHIPFFEIENMLICESFIKELIAFEFGHYDDSLFQKIKNKVKEKFIDTKNIWIVRHIAFDLRGNFDYRGKIKSLVSVDELKTLYNTERLTDSDIDNKKNFYEHEFNTIIEKDCYDSFLYYLDCKNIMNECDNILFSKSKRTYLDALFKFLETERGECVLESFRALHFNKIGN